MYAIVKHSGRQFKVEQGQELKLDWADVKPGDKLKLDQVLAVGGDSGLKLGPGNGSSVTVEVVGVEQGPKLTVQKFRRRKTFRKRTGHRQLFTRVKVSAIDVA
jgi:large subunit ribosomal protein L21